MSDLVKGSSKSSVSVVTEDDSPDVLVKHENGISTATLQRKKQEGHRINVDDIGGRYGPEHSKGVLDKICSKLGFRFPNSTLFVGEYSGGFKFHNYPDMRLPENWELRARDIEGQKNSLEIRDGENRLRGFYDVSLDIQDSDKFFQRHNMMLYPRFSFDVDIVASTPSVVLPPRELANGMTVSPISGGNHYWMPSIKSEFNDVVACFTYVHPGFWPMGKCDFTRINKEHKAIEEATRFIAQETKTAFDGANIRAGTDKEIIRCGGEAMTAGIDLPGDVFAHWYDGEEDVALEKLANLREKLEQEVPEILGKDNSLVYSVFPSDEEIQTLKNNTPNYTPPMPQAWQKAVYRTGDVVTGGINLTQRLTQGVKKLTYKI